MKLNEFHKPSTSNIIYLARGGGGGSSSGGGGGGSSSGSSHSSSSSSRSSSSSGGSGAALPWWETLIIIAIFFGIPILFIVLAMKFGKKLSSNNLAIPNGFKNAKQGSDEEKNIAKSAEETFLAFQKAWSEFDLKTMQKITSSEFYKKMVLELQVLKNYSRTNSMENVAVDKIYVSEQEEYSDGYRIYFSASSTDKLIDNKENKTLFTDSSSFAEIWTFIKKGKIYVLDGIRQTTEDSSKYVPAIAEFAKTNGFYYDPDFGWLMMPSHGAIFGPAGFGNADINNHVIGYYQDKKRSEKIVEFYSYEPKAGVGMKPFIVAQAILPRKYDNILVTEKSWYDFKPKAKGLAKIKIETESVEFNNKFAIWAADTDKATSFELLATNFMERIYALEFEINIEVVDNVLYLYSPSSSISYQDMLDVLSWAFEEMKM
ncbi:MAG TPA: DUF3137 domain-containing protein [Candidatus Saccharibacteria bacterium]|nr:DUF3137 domain-containing protein [Candidatus Saccharibacteria bacterium]HMT39835.1 DUF3137 domain-containing protein [Candidatus Saccharibacteria bacterium]